MGEASPLPSTVKGESVWSDAPFTGSRAIVDGSSCVDVGKMDWECSRRWWGLKRSNTFISGMKHVFSGSFSWHVKRKMSDD